MNIRIGALAVIAAGLLGVGSARGEPNPPVGLRCEYLTDPACVGEARPRFSWEVDDPRRGARQSAYQVRVTVRTPDGPEVWSSGRVESDATAHVEYGGPALRPGERYSWRVRTWDAQGEPSSWSEPARFAMGLLRPEDWQARWIGDPAPPPPAARARNGYHSGFADAATTEKWVTIDLGEVRELDEVRLFPARPYDAPDTPGFCFPVRYRLLAGEAADLSDGRVIADRTDDEQSSPGAEPVTFDVGPVRARYVRLVATRLRERPQGRFALALAEMQALKDGRVLSQGAPAAALDSIETGEWAAANLTDGDLVSHAGRGMEALPAPMLRREFDVPGPVGRATLYVSALGLYEARINGECVGDHELAPEWTDYGTRVQYQGYDVTDLVRPGANAIGVQLADGWYAGRLGMAERLSESRRPRGLYGRQPRLLAQLHLEMEDGTVQRVATDGSWHVTLDGPVRSADLLDGEMYDARQGMRGWDLPGFAEGASGAAWRPAAVDEGVNAELVAQPNEPIRAIEELAAVAMAEPRPGVYVFDLGQNMPGRCRVRVRGRAGAELTLRHAEAVNDDGTLYTANLRGAPQVDRYVLRGDPAGEAYEPRFTYHGFRYVELSGPIEPPSRADVTGVVVCSSSPVAASFECSNPMLNRLWRNLLWTQHANMMSVPTDCPQRDERLGWTGDITAYGQTAAFHKDMAAFFTKWLQDVRDAQADDGRYPDFAPHPYGRNRSFTGVPGWGDAGVFVPWASWVNYGDARLLERHFDSACRWVDWIGSKNPDHVWRNERGNDYNDWLNADTIVRDGWPRQGGAVPKEIFATAFYARSAELIASMALALGKQEEHERYTDLRRRIGEAFAREFIGPDGMMPGDTQAGYALALAFGLMPEDLRNEAVAHLVRGVRAYDDHLSTGFHTTHLAMLELTRAGHADLAYRLATDTRFPSWGYSIENGATTIWERWDGYVKGRGFQDPGMNSLNHWALGSVGEWMMRTIAGINPDEASPGWERFTLRPVVGGGLTFARASHRCIRGTIESAWRVEEGRVVYEFTIPANTAAAVHLAAAGPERVRESGRTLENAEGVRVVGVEDGTVVLEVGAGRYVFEVDRRSR